MSAPPGGLSPPEFFAFATCDDKQNYRQRRPGRREAGGSMATLHLADGLHLKG